MDKYSLAQDILKGITLRLNRGEVSSKGILVLFTGSNLGIDKKIEELALLRQYGISVSIGISFMGERIINLEKVNSILKPIKIYKEEDIFNLENLEREYSLLIVPNITINTLSKVSLGILDSLTSNIIWDFLYSGKKVLIDLESAREYRGRASKNVEINKTVNFHIDRLKNMGADEVNRGIYIEKTLSSLGLRDDVRHGTEAIESFNEENGGRKIVTENDLKKLVKGEELTLSSNVILTPLAKDKIKELGIKIKNEY